MYFMVHIIFNNSYYKGRASQVDLVVKNASANAEDVRDLGLIPGSGKAPWRRKWQPTSVFQENPTDRGAWQTTVHEVTVLDITEET